MHGNGETRGERRHRAVVKSKRCATGFGGKAPTVEFSQTTGSRLVDDGQSSQLTKPLVRSDVAARAPPFAWFRPPYHHPRGGVFVRVHHHTTARMHLTVTTEDDKIVTVEVDPGTEVLNLKAILEAETGVSCQAQVLLHNGKELGDGSTLVAAGVGDGELVMLLRRRQQASTARGSSNPTALHSDGSAVDPGAFQAQIRQDAHTMRQLESGNPQLHSAILNPDPSAMQTLLRMSHQARQQAEAAQNAEIDLLNADPFDTEAQAKIEEQIRLQNVDANYETAMDTTPEAFGSVIMLYVDITVNGHAIKAFIDSGAQMTIMSLGCAQRLGLERLIDKRFMGVAKGVGTQKIIGKVHQAPISVAGVLMPCAITVLEKEQDMDFIWGLDMLKRHQCVIDLEKNVLRIGTIDKTCAFLGEHELPAFARPANGAGDGEKTDATNGGGGGAASGSGISSDPIQLAGDGLVGGNTDSNDQGAPAPAPGAAPADLESKVAKLVELGFDRAKCLQALASSDGNEEYAASLLFSGF